MPMRVLMPYRRRATMFRGTDVPGGQPAKARSRRYSLTLLLVGAFSRIEMAGGGARILRVMRPEVVYRWQDDG